MVEVETALRGEHSLLERHHVSNYYRAIFFFFVQAVAGIRGTLVTGVQTCALPICPGGGGPAGRGHPRGPAAGAGAAHGGSEERRVGKECRARWSPYHEKKKKEHSGDGERVLLKAEHNRQEKWKVALE